MEGNLHAFGLILVVAVTLFALISYPAKPAGLAQIVIALLAGGGLMIVCQIAGTHMCDAGQPFLQYIIPGTCLILLRSLTRHRCRPARIIAWCLCLAAFILTFHYDDLVHGQHYTGNPARVGHYLQVEQRSNIQQVEASLIMISQDYHDSKHYPASWMDQFPQQQLIAKELGNSESLSRNYKSQRAVAFPLWHSRFTGLYGKTMTDVYLWYSGGKLEDAMGKLEYRPR